MNLQQLEYIVAVHQHKSFTKAASQCCVTQATLSAMIKKLEDELGVVIFDRKKSPILTTCIGERIIADAQPILQALNHIKDYTKKEGVVQGRLRLGVIPTVANALLPLFLKQLLEVYPLLELEVFELTTPILLQQLREGRIDVAWMSNTLAPYDMEEQLLYYEPLLVYGSSHGDTYVLPEALKEERVWLLEQGHCLREQVANFCQLKKGGLRPSNLHFEANSLSALLTLVDTFGGLTLVPLLYTHQLSEVQKNRLSPFQTPAPVRAIQLVYYRPYAKQTLIQALAQNLGQFIAPYLEKTDKNVEILVLEL
jgi:LysR family transcriptional regulator, hydrogen peroxide-inducible genes activator